MKLLDKKNVVRYLLFLAICLRASLASGQFQHLSFNRLTIQEGLPEQSIACLTQDKLGYIWLGTQVGLVRFDGYQPVVYNFGQENPANAAVSAVLEDKSGILWIGTFSLGLYYYDRQEDKCKSYTPAKGDSISSPYVKSIFDGGDHIFWLVTYNPEKQIDCIDRLNVLSGKITHYSFLEKGKHHLDAKTLNDFQITKNGEVWIGTDNGFYKYISQDDYFVGHFTNGDSATARHYDQLIADPLHPGVIWMSLYKLDNAGAGVLRYDSKSGKGTIYRHIPNDRNSIGSDSVFMIKTDHQNRLWFVTSAGLSLSANSLDSFVNYKISSPENGSGKFAYMKLLHFDGEGNIWLGGAKGLLYFDTHTHSFNNFNDDEISDHLKNGSISNFLDDRNGTLWIGTHFGGLYWINKNKSNFKLFAKADSKPFGYPGGASYGIAEANDQAFWVAGEKGFYHWFPKKDSFVLLNLDPSIKNIGAYKVLIDQDGKLWCGTAFNGLFQYDVVTHNIIHFTFNRQDSTSISSNSINAMFQDSKGRLWIGTRGGGLCQFRHKTNDFRRYPYLNTPVNMATNKSLDYNFVNVIFEDVHHTIWVGTSQGGLNRFNEPGENFTSYHNDPRGLENVLAIIALNPDSLFVGTYLSGLFLFNTQTNSAQKIPESQGLLYNGCWILLKDDDQNIWIGSRRGFNIINIKNHTTRNISNLNGFPEAEIWLPGIKTSDGKFIVSCSSKNILEFDPKDFRPDTVPPQLHIEKLSFSSAISSKHEVDSIILLFGKTDVHLHYNENRITFHYTALSYQDPSLNQYAYQLEGYDNTWVQGGTQREVVYTNLNPGKYTFHVKAANSDGVWDSADEKIVVIISPPWWQTWWAYCAYAILFASVLWAFIRYRISRIRRENAALEQKVSLKTVQLNRSLEDLKSTQSQLIHSEKMASLGELTAGIAHEIQNPLNFVNNFSELNKELLLEMKDELNKDNIELAWEIANDVIENSEKINYHGKRADSIVKGMLEHSRTRTGKKELTNINTLADEYLRLSYHGVRAKDKQFIAAMKTDFEEAIETINIIPQDIGRVLLNLYNNAFYAVKEKKKQHPEDYEPLVSVSTKKLFDRVEIRVKDNGNGIPPNIVDKIFQPFFTTKPTGQGTGLGLSLTYDIIKAHNGDIKAESKEGEGTEFVVLLPIA